MKITKNKTLKKIRESIDSLDGEKSLGSLQDIDVSIEKTNGLLEKVKKVLKELSNDKDKVKKVEVTNPREIDKKIEVKNLSDIKFPQEMKVNNFPKQKFQKEIKVSNLEDIKIPNKLEITNFPKQKEINIPEFPKEISIKKPSWYQAITENSLLVLLQSIANYILKRLSEMTFKSDLDVYKKKDNSLAVRLIDEKGNEYTAISNLVGGGGGLNQKETTDAINNSSLLTLIKDKFTVHREHIKTIGFKEAIGHGATDGNIKVERASGKKTEIGTGDFALIESHAFVQPSANTQMYLQSSSANDTAAGTGIQLITIEYFESAWGARKTVNVIPNGANQVTISVADIYRIHRIYGAEGHSAQGDITITNQAANILYGQIDANHTYMERCIFYVAEGETITCTEAILGSVTSGGVQIRLFATEEDADGNTLTRGRLPFEIVSGSLDSTFSVSESIKNTNNKRMSIGLVVKSAGTAANQSVTGALKGYRCIC
ncbi:MAG: hypothetical protein KAT66_00715 [Candidatus Lokiarchaeota archaeon]|nr:hypothetical protein [Candidatus Lokiarchaeota archaeon]